MRKVFGIGFHKTGTTTLDSALQILGFSIAPVRTDLVKSLSKGDMNPTLEVANTYNAFQDNPWPILFKEMYSEFPNSKFILTIREQNKWISSVVNSFGGKSTAMREWIYGENHGDPKENEAIYLERYSQHYREVHEFFEDKKGRLLEVNWEDECGWKVLCDFLQMEEPNIDFPHANKGDYQKSRKKKFRLFQ